jgi:hypothetical protein
MLVEIDNGKCVFHHIFSILQRGTDQVLTSGMGENPDSKPLREVGKNKNKVNASFGDPPENRLIRPSSSCFFALNSASQKRG